MEATVETSVAIVIRVASPGHAAFLLRKGEQGLSVFDPRTVDPPLTDEEILEAFRQGSIVVYRTHAEILKLRLRIVACEGDISLPERLRLSHNEIRSGDGMSRDEFKNALKELE
ncbi:MAG TPA: hypothetical protein VN641_15720 [Urbifossiella sp.]|jgi:hypothetical protein|nr:hypothetical protein [Urbifossiella sp.]